ncbi:MAG: nicotinate-nucleotide--dimethylbenzimidazole phosphoribosyltransferase [Mariprofundus sp.]|nr:nicotinate-nucleotide--dimethylbenzimidazole phosphoribosyltransferase [Mariprofundus sp.]
MMEIPAIHPELELHNDLLKPNSCMSHMEDIATWFSKRQNQSVPTPIQATVVLFAADHGVAASLPYRDKTIALLRQNSAPDSAIRTLCKQAGAKLHIVDLGVIGNVVNMEDIEHAKVSSTGSFDITSEAAMGQMEYWESVGIGEEMAHRAIADGANLLIASSIACHDNIAIAAIIAELTGLQPEMALMSTTDPDLYSRELIAVERAITRARATPSHDILRELGSLEIAAMAGFYRAAAAKGVPILLDGRASAAAALAAIAWDVRIAGWLLASHVSNDAGHREAIEQLGLEPMVELKSSIEQGKMAVLLLPVIQSAITLQRGLSAIELTL